MKFALNAIWFAAVLGCALGAMPANSQEGDVPSACQMAVDRSIQFSDPIAQWQACAEAAPQGSSLWQLSKMNLATMAFEQQDFPAALALYDELDKGAMTILSDPYFHYARLVTFLEMGRDDRALKEARNIAELALAGQDPGASGEAAQILAGSWSEHPFMLSAMAVSISLLKKDGNEDGLAKLRIAIRTVPVTDEFDAVNFLYVLDELGLAGALEPRVMEMADRYPSEPGVLNNICYIMVKAGAAERYLGRCRRAVSLSPEIPNFQHSLYAAYATLGRCDEAKTTYDAAVALLSEGDDGYDAYACPIKPEDLRG
jgi:tetratricopeptide (TPR) repeat protein